MKNKGAILLLSSLILFTTVGFLSYSDFQDKKLRHIEHNAFRIGESLKFWLGWQGINAGEAELKIVDKVKFNDRWVYYVKSEARSNKTISKFFKVRDVVETFIDTAGIFTLKFEKHLREGSYKSDKLYYFNPYKNIAISSKNDTIEVPENVQDILSAFYYVRTRDLKVGDKFIVPNFDNGKNYNIEVNVYKKERVKVEAGEFDCIKIEPILEDQEGLFKRKGRLFIWLTDDERHIPVLMRSKAPIGAFEARLISMKGV